jgi:hypothetical protein
LRKSRRVTFARLRSWSRAPRVRLEDARRNRRVATAEERFLVVRHWSNPDFYDFMLEWFEANIPSLRARFELHLLPDRIPDASRYVLHIPWLQDPVEAWSPRTYERAVRLARRCHDRGIPTINRVDRLGNAQKSVAARLMADVGVRTPRMEPIRDREQFVETFLGLGLPLFVREDRGHGGPICRADEPHQVKAIPLHRFSRPVAVELIDARDPRDGLYRKYRYLAAGNAGVSHHLHVSERWVTRGNHGVYSEALVEEEKAFTSAPNPHHEQLQRARSALGLDVVALDYGYDRAGQMVVWEANPFPWLKFPVRHRSYRREPYERALAALGKLYLTRAGLPVPCEIRKWLAFDPLAGADA